MPKIVGIIKGEKFDSFLLDDGSRIEGWLVPPAASDVRIINTSLGARPAIYDPATPRDELKAGTPVYYTGGVSQAGLPGVTD